MSTLSRIVVCLGALALGGLSLTAAQDKVTIPLTDPSQPVTLKVSVLNGGITVKGASVKDVVVVANVRERESNGKAGTAHRIPINTTGLAAEEEDNVVQIGCDSTGRTVDLDITVPTRSSLILRSVNNGDIVVTGVNGEMDVNNVNGDVTLAEVSGSAVAHALNGKVLVAFRSVNTSKPMAFSSLNGDIDVTFPADIKAKVSLKTDRGEVYSDFDLKLTAEAPQPVVQEKRTKSGKYVVKIDKTVRGTINGGGQELQFTNYQGDIYIRKAGHSAD